MEKKTHESLVSRRLLEDRGERFRLRHALHTLSICPAHDFDLERRRGRVSSFPRNVAEARALTWRRTSSDRRSRKRLSTLLVRDDASGDLSFLQSFQSSFPFSRRSVDLLGYRSVVADATLARADGARRFAGTFDTTGDESRT